MNRFGEVIGGLLLAIMAARSGLPAPPGGQESVSPQVVEHFRAGQQDLRSGRPNEAVEQFQAVVRLAPALSEARINLGLAYHLLGKYRLAATELEKGLKQNPNVLGGNIILGLDELRLGAAAKAVPPLRRAAQLDPSNLQAWSSLAAAYLALGHYLEASQAYRAAFGKKPTAENWLHLGHAYLQMSSQLTARMGHEYGNTGWAKRLAGDLLSERQLWSDAAQRYRLALARDPAQPGLHSSLANALLKQGSTAEAKAEFRKEAKIDETQRPGWSACQAHHYDACVQYLETRRQLNRAHLVALGDAQFALGRYPEASDAFATVWAQGQRDPETLYWLIRSYSKIADGCFSRLAASYPNSAQAHALEAESYRARGEDDKAVTEYLLASALQPENASLHEALGELYLDKHQLSEAQNELRKALELDPARARALYLMGRLEIGQQKPQSAIPYLEKALSYDPQLLEARASLGLAYLRAGKPALAVPQFQRSISLDYYGDLHYMLYQAYRELGNRDLAESALSTSQALRRKTQSRDQALIRSAESQ